MSHPRLNWLRIPIVLFSLSLLVAYVYHQAGGELFAAGTANQQRTTIHRAEGTESRERRLLGAIEERDAAAAELQRAEESSRRTPGSVSTRDLKTLRTEVEQKNRAVGIVKNGGPSSNTPRATSKPSTEKPAPKILPGSKSMAVFPAHQATPVQVQKSRDLLPGPKSAPIFQPASKPPAQQAVKPRDTLQNLGPPVARTNNTNGLNRSSTRD